MPANRKYAPTREEIADQLKAFNRGPFLEVLADLMSCAPTLEDIETMAKDDPNKWAKTVQIIAKLSGYHDKLEITGNIAVEIKGLGDAQLLSKIEEVSKKLSVLNKADYTLIEGEVEKEGQKNAPGS